MDVVKPTGSKDVVLHLGLIATLYWTVIHIGMLLFQLINRWIPDALSDRYPWYDGRYGPLRWSLAATVVVFPLYLWATWATERDLTRHPEKRGLRTRRWLLYFTLLGTAMTIAGNLIAVVNEFLRGEITLRFILKIAAVLVIAVAVGGYYLLMLRRDDGQPTPSWMRVFTGTIIALGVAVIIAGFVTIGTPVSERLRRFDDQRVRDLRAIQSHVVSSWQRDDRLPATLDELRSEFDQYTSPRDPQDDSPYGYHVLGPLQFELCAVFRTTSDAGMRTPKRAYDGESWAHGKGRTCFTRTIDPKRYDKRAPPRPEIID